MRTHAGTSALLCPIDRNVIDVTKVCDESGLRRTIGCLVVKCGSHGVGCTWEGQLSDLSVHEEHCQYNNGQQQVHQQQPDNRELISMVEVLRNRMDSYEECLEKKDKELAHMKTRLQDEVNTLKQNEAQLKKQLEKVKQENAEIKTQLESSKAANQLSEEEIQSQRNVVIKLTSSQAGVSVQDSVQPPGSTGTKGPAVNKLVREPILGPVFKFYRGSAADVLITADNHFNFGKKCSVLGIPSAVVCLGDKMYFEVTCAEMWLGGCCGFGWAPRDFKSSIENVSVDKVHGVKWYIPTSRRCYEDGKNVSPYYDLGRGRASCMIHYFGVSQLGSEYVIGVAVDMTKGELLYSFNGKWDKPCGVAFKDLDKVGQYIPVLAGSNITLTVNLGGTDFKHAPPDQSYKKRNELFL